ncbi:Calcium-dependent protein kinase 27 [Durusdinium trenchii]|uniref:Calcium-dependent protein kinase 27 n=1 Tax=Durusdinium trenchii TaxID=1381693 RepID=A0ABP0R3R0_9DINO
MASIATSALNSGRCGQPAPVAGGFAPQVRVSPVRWVASPRTSPVRCAAAPNPTGTILPTVASLPSQILRSTGVPRAPSPVSPVRAAAMQQMYAPLARRSPRHSRAQAPQAAPQPQAAQAQALQAAPAVPAAPVPATAPATASTAPASAAPAVSAPPAAPSLAPVSAAPAAAAPPAIFVARWHPQVSMPLVSQPILMMDRRSPSPFTRLSYQISRNASPARPAVASPPKQAAAGTPQQATMHMTQSQPGDSPISTATVLPVPLSTPALSDRTTSPVPVTYQFRQGGQPVVFGGHERVRPLKGDKLAETARASLWTYQKDTFLSQSMANPQTAVAQVEDSPLPDPLLTAHGSPCAMARTPDPPSSRKLSSVLESQPSLASTFLGRDSPPQYTSAKLLRTSSSKRSRGMSPGPPCVVRPPSPKDPSHKSVNQHVLQDLQAGGAKAGAANVVLALFELFCTALADATIIEQVCGQLTSQKGKDELRWDDLVVLRPLQTLAQRIASLLPGSGQLKDEAFWQILGNEEAYMPWWKALMARYGLHCSGDSLANLQLLDLITLACRLLRDSFAPDSYLRNLRTVRLGAHRLGERYEDFQLLSSHRLGRSYRCRGRLSFEDRLCSQFRKDRIACPSDQVRSEAETLRSMQHPNLHRVVESFEDFNSIYIISELVDSIRLLAFVRSRFDSHIEMAEGWLSQVLRQVLEALSFCHQLTPRCVVHGDLGMDSIGLASISDPATSPHVIISDLALAGFLRPPGNKVTPPQREETSFWRFFPSDYLADLECCSPKQDVWACGCLLYILLSGYMPISTNDISFGGPFQPPAKAVVYDIEWSNLRHASAQAEALCSRMLESNPAQRPTAEECLCYPWLQPGAAAFLNHKVPLSVLDRLVKYDSRIWGSKELVSQVMNELSSKSVSSASRVFAEATLPEHFDGTLDSIDKVAMTPVGGVAPLLQLGLSVQSVEKIMQVFDVDGQGTVAHGYFIRRCMELAEDHVDRALWHIFIAAKEDHRGVLGAAKLEQVLDSGAMKSQGCQDSDMEGSAPQYIRAAMDPELTASEAVRQIAQGGNEVTFEALKEFVMQRHDAACATAAKGLGLI